MSVLAFVALVQASEYIFLPPICLAIALVTSAAHREDMRAILAHTLRSWILLMVGILAFMVAISFLFEWVLPGS
jgi:hypothetical protein